MASDGLTGTPFEDPSCPTPSAADGTTIGERGGAPWTDAPKETENMSELGTLPYTTDVKDGPAPGSQVAVEPGVASPAIAITPIA